MADLVLGLAKYVVEGVLTKAQAAIEEEEHLRRSAQSNLVFISGEFEMMHSFLKVANTERVENPVVRMWVRQIRELAYDVEDCIEFVIHLDKRTRFWLVFRRMIPSCGMASALPLPLDEAVGEIEQLKARVEEVSTRNTRYSLIGDTGAKPIVVHQQLEPEAGVAAVSATTSNMLGEARGTTKRQKFYGDLTRLIIDKSNANDHLQVVSVWGSGGDHGTTSIIRKTYNNQSEICENFTYRAWVKLMHPFTPHDFIRTLMAQFYANSPWQQQQQKAATSIGMHVLSKMVAAQEDLFKEFEQLVTHKRFLVVLEGLSNMLDWDAIRTFFPDMKNGSWVIVSTQQCEIATLCVGHTYQILELKKFSDHHSVCAVVKQPTPAGTAVTSTTFDMLAEARQQGFGDLTLTRLITMNNNDALDQVISVWGAGGNQGITSIIKNAYNHPDICNNITFKRAWVKLTHPFIPLNFISTIQDQFYANSPREEENDAIIDRRQVVSQEEFKLLVRQKRYLIFLEGLSSIQDWRSIRTLLPDTNNGSWIIVATQQCEIATLCIGHSYQILELKKFSDDHSVCALLKASHGDGNKGNEEIQNCSSNTSTLQEGGTMLNLLMKWMPFTSKVRTYSSSESPDISLMHEAGQSSTSHDKKAAVDWMKNCLLVGRESLMKELGKYAAKARANSPPVMSVWGIAGVGKSALVKNLYYDGMLRSNQFDKYYWVDVSHPFNLRDLYMSLLSDFHSEKDPIEECNHLLKNERCFIVIDDLRSREEWDLIQAALVSKGSRSIIIVITTDASIAAYCTNSEELVFNVKALEDAAAFDLFKKQVFKNNPSSPLKVQDVEVQEVIFKCGGIPKVISAIAGVLASKKEDKLEDTVLSLNRRFMHHLEKDPEYDILKDLFDWIRTYFRNCPDYLKPCIFYLSIFPQGNTIRRRRLVRRWIAEGYSRDSHNESAEENGEKHFSELLELSMIQQLSSQSSSMSLNVDTVRMALCKVNGFIREYVVSQRMEENLVFELGDKCALTTQRTGRHLVILEDWDRDIIVFKSIDFSRLRSLTVFGKCESFFISESMKMLRVLDLEDASTDLNEADLDKIVKCLCRLKFLSLRGHGEIQRLPSSLGKLRQLQTLDVRDTSIVTLPKSITKLHKVQYIRAGTSAGTHVAGSWFCRRRRLVGVVVPRGVVKLTALHTLGVVDIASSGRKSILKKLKKLTQLRKLGVSGINKKNIKEFFSAIQGHVHLQSLSVRLDKDDNQGDCLDDISLPWEKNLQSLKLYGLQDKLPALIKQLTNLRKLDVEMAELMSGDMEHLGKLPELCILRLAVKQPSISFCVMLYGMEEKSFEKVTILEIACSCSSLLHVTFGSRTMKNLELLKVDCSSELSSYQLTGLNYLSELKEVLLKDTNKEALKTDLEKQLLNHPKKPAVKLEERRSTQDRTVRPEGPTSLQQ